LHERDAILSLHEDARAFGEEAERHAVKVDKAVAEALTKGRPTLSGFVTVCRALAWLLRRQGGVKLLRAELLGRAGATVVSLDPDASTD